MIEMSKLERIRDALQHNGKINVFESEESHLPYAKEVEHQYPDGKKRTDIVAQEFYFLVAPEKLIYAEDHADYADRGYFYIKEEKFAKEMDVFMDSLLTELYSPIDFNKDSLRDYDKINLNAKINVGKDVHGDRMQRKATVSEPSDGGRRVFYYLPSLHFQEKIGEKKEIYIETLTEENTSNIEGFKGVKKTIEGKSDPYWRTINVIAFPCEEMAKTLAEGEDIIYYQRNGFRNNACLRDMKREGYCWIDSETLAKYVNSEIKRGG